MSKTNVVWLVITHLKWYIGYYLINKCVVNKGIIMLLEYCASDTQDRLIERALKNIVIDEWFNPSDDYYVLETQDDRAVTILALLGIEVVLHPAEQESDK